MFAALPSWNSTLRARFDSSRLDQIASTQDVESQFAAFWQQQRSLHPGEIPFDHETYVELEKARIEGQSQFATAFVSALARLSIDERTSLEQQDFEIAEQNRLATEWWDRDPTAISIRHYFSDELPNWLKRSGATLQSLIGACLAIPVQIGIALLLSFLITVDVHRIRETLAGLRNTRIRTYFDEVAAELSVFARLLGKSLEAQIVIAAVSAVLTFLAMWCLGIDSKYFLALIRFGPTPFDSADDAACVARHACQIVE
jgi:hypothetical protein